LNLTEKNKFGHYPFLTAENNSEILKLLQNYAEEHNTTIKTVIHEREFWQAIKGNNFSRARLILNKYENEKYYSISDTTDVDYLTKVELIIDFANKYNIILDLNYKNPLFKAAYYCNAKMAKLIIDYAIKHNIKLNITEKVEVGRSVFLMSMYTVEIFKMVIEYALKNNISIDINESDDGWTPLLFATNNNITEMVKTIIYYANNTNTILNINEKNKEGDYPLLYASIKNNTEMIILIKKYADVHKIKLEWDDRITNNEILKILKN